MPSTDARPTLRRGFRTRPAAIEAHSTPMNENRATPAAIETASQRLPPEALNGGKLDVLMKNQPRTPTRSNGTYLSTTVTFWNQAMPRMPPRLTTAGIHRPVRAMSMFVAVEGFSIPNRDST